MTKTIAKLECVQCGAEGQNSCQCCAPYMPAKKTPPKLHCGSCGASVNAVCNCGVEYISAGKFAENLIKEHPDMSDRAIAEQYGIGKETIRRTRKSVAPNGPPEDRNPKLRTGKDGKRYPATRQAPAARVIPYDEAVKQVREIVERQNKNHQRLVELLESHKHLIDNLSADVLPANMITKYIKTAKDTAKAWLELVKHLEERLSQTTAPAPNTSNLH